MTKHEAHQHGNNVNKKNLYVGREADYKREHYLKNKKRYQRLARKRYMKDRKRLLLAGKMYYREHIKQKQLYDKLRYRKLKTLKPWVYTLWSCKKRCKYKQWSHARRGIKCFLTISDLKYLWFRDKAYKLTQPSIDRINNNGNYELSNCRYIELSENSRKSNG